MVMCYAPDCKHYSERDGCRKYFRFPKELKERKKWISLLRRADKEPSVHALVCSCHFVNGEKKNRPTMFLHNRKKQLVFHSPEKKKSSIQKKEVPISEGLLVRDVQPCTSSLSISELLASQPSTSAQGISYILEDHASSSQCSTYAQGTLDMSIHQPSTSSLSMSELLEPQPSTSAQSISDILEDQASSSQVYTYAEDTFDMSIDQPSTSLTMECSSGMSSTISMSQEASELENYKNELMAKDVKIGNLEFQIRQMKQDRISAFSFAHIANEDKYISMYTGLPNKDIYMFLYNMIEKKKLNYYLNWNVTSIPKIDQLLMFLMKMRLNLPHEDLACRFRCSSTTFTNIVHTFLSALHFILFKKFMETVPSRQKNKRSMPNCFAVFTNCRIVLDCTEVYTAVPKNIRKQRLTYSAYKHRNTLNGLIGVAPNGVINFISELFPGSTSDKNIVQKCGILDILVEVDLVVADKGFLIRDILPNGVSLNIPPFLFNQQFTEEEVYQTQNIARARIHVERAICRMKNYRILNFIQSSLVPYATDIFQTVGALTLLQFPLIDEVSTTFMDA